MERGRCSFGIGCFHLSYKTPPSWEAYDARKYLDQLQSVLAAVPGVTNLQIEHPREILTTWKGTTPDTTARLELGPYFLRHIIGLTIRFEVDVPVESRARAFTWFEREADLYGGPYLVRIVYPGTWLPVAFVAAVKGDDASPSTGVAVVGKYLDYAVGQQELSPLMFERLGPSPFHVDCQLTSEQANIRVGSRDQRKNRRFVLQIDRERGYWRITFFARPNVFRDVGEALLALWEEVSDELSYFYYVVQTTNRLVEKAAEVEQKAQDFISLQRERGAVAVFRRLNAAGRARDVFLSLAELDVEVIAFVSSEKNWRESVYAPGALACFDHFIEEELEFEGDRDARRRSEVVTLFEERRIRQLEILAVIASGFMGGGIGAVLTVILTK